jgi:integrase
MPQKLSQQIVKRLVPPERGDITFWDAELKGFGVRVFAPTGRKPHGNRSFFINYRIDGIERRWTIGGWPDWTVEAARDEAKEVRRRIDKGEDPASMKRARREAPTVKDLAQRYKTEHLVNKADSSQINDWAMIQNDILPRIGAQKVGEVHSGDIAALHKAISARGKVRANRILACCSKMFSLALMPAEGEIEPWRNQNPCKGIRRNPEEGRERFFSSAEIAALSDALEAHGHTPAADCIRFLLMTGCRPGEAMLAKWDQFDVEPGFWVKPAAHTKTRRIHRIPLGPGAVELLQRIRTDRKKAARSKDSAYVFPGQVYGEPLKQIRSCWQIVTECATVALWKSSADSDVAAVVADLERAFGRLATVADCRTEAERRRVKLPTGLIGARPYDLRHTFASIGAGGGMSLHIIGKLLGHTQARTTARYAHLADDPLREAAEKIGGVIVGAGKVGAGVLPFKKGMP